MNLPYQGEIFSVVSAFAWAVAVILFRVSGRKVGPLSLNLFKSTLAGLLLLLTGRLVAPAHRVYDWRVLSLLVVSGLLGIALSDTLFFFCLNKLGASLTAIVECLYSPFVIGLSLVFLKESLKARQLLGVTLILLAIVGVTWRGGEGERRSSRDLLQGVLAGAASMFFMAAGIVMIKPLLNHIPIIWAAAVRMSSGAFFLGLAMMAHPARKKMLSPLLSLDNWAIMVTASLIGAYGGIIAWVAGMKFTAVSIAAPLNQLSTVFIFLLAVLFLKEKSTFLRLLALGLAFAGAFLASWA